MSNSKLLLAAHMKVARQFIGLSRPQARRDLENMPQYKDDVYSEWTP